MWYISIPSFAQDFCDYFLIFTYMWYDSVPLFPNFMCMRYTYQIPSFPHGPPPWYFMCMWFDISIPSFAHDSVIILWHFTCVIRYQQSTVIPTLMWCCTVVWIFFYCYHFSRTFVIITSFFTGAFDFWSIEHKMSAAPDGFAFLRYRPRTNQVWLGSPSDFLWYLICISKLQTQRYETNFIFVFVSLFFFHQYLQSCVWSCLNSFVLLICVEVLIHVHSITVNTHAIRTYWSYTHSCMQSHTYTHWHCPLRMHTLLTCTCMHTATHWHAWIQTHTCTNYMRYIYKKLVKPFKHL